MPELNANRPYSLQDLTNASDDLKYALSEHNKTKIALDNARKMLTDAEKAEAEAAKVVETRKKRLFTVIATVEK